MNLSLDDSVRPDENEADSDEDEDFNSNIVEFCDMFQLVQSFEGQDALTILIKHVAGVKVHVLVKTTHVKIVFEHPKVDQNFLEVGCLPGEKLQLSEKFQAVQREVFIYSFRPLEPKSKTIRKHEDSTTKEKLYSVLKILYENDAPAAELL